MEIKVGIIILNWNSYDITHDCLMSLSKLNIEKLAVTIYVVDNGSTDDSVEKLNKSHPEITLLISRENVGYTGGNNIGIRRALNDGCSFFWILNNDTTVDRMALQSLIHTAKQNTVGIVSSKIYFARGHEYHRDRYKPSERGHVIWYAGGIIDWKNMYGLHKGVDEVDRGQFRLEEETDYATGCSLLLTQSVIDTIGIFDERYFAYFEDMDLSIRAKHHGFRVVYCPDSIVWHINAGSTAKPGNAFQQYYQIRNRFLIGMTYAPERTKLALLREGMRILFTAKGAKRQGIRDAFLGRYGGKFIWKK